MPNANINPALAEQIASMQENDRTCSNAHKYDTSRFFDTDYARLISAAKDTPISFKQAKDMFDEVQNDLGKMLFYSKDGCWLKAHLISGYFLQNGIMPHKAWLIAPSFNDKGKPNDKLYPISSNLMWDYHVAAAIKIEADNAKGFTPVVFDHALFNAPEDVRNWRSHIDGRVVTNRAEVHKIGSGMNYNMEKLTSSTRAQMDENYIARTFKEFCYMSATVQTSSLYHSSLSDKFNQKAIAKQQIPQIARPPKSLQLQINF